MRTYVRSDICNLFHCCTVCSCWCIARGWLLNFANHDCSSVMMKPSQRHHRTDRLYLGRAFLGSFLLANHACDMLCFFRVNCLEYLHTISIAVQQKPSTWASHTSSTVKLQSHENTDLGGFKFSTRGNQKVLQFSMMYKWHRQNSYIIFQCNLPVHQYTSDIC